MKRNNAPTRPSAKLILVAGFMTMLAVDGIGANDRDNASRSSEDTPSARDPHRHHHAMLSANTSYRKSRENYTIPDVTLLDAYGNSIPLKKALEGDRPIILNFIFTSCTSICPIMSATFSSAHERFSHNSETVKFVSISIDPEHDTPEKLRTYSEKHGADTNWIFLTGTLEDIITVQKAFLSYRGDKMNHAPATFIRASTNSPWTRLDGFTSSEDLVSEYHDLLKP